MPRSSGRSRRSWTTLAVLGSVAESVVVVRVRVDAPLQRQADEKLDDVRVAVLGSGADSVVVVCAQVDATLQRQIEEKPDDLGPSRQRCGERGCCSRPGRRHAPPQGIAPWRRSQQKQLQKAWMRRRPRHLSRTGASGQCLRASSYPTRRAQLHQASHSCSNPKSGGRSRPCPSSQSGTGRRRRPST